MALKHASSGEVVDLQPLRNDLKGAKTTAIVKADRFEAIRLVLLEGKTIPSHEVSGEITLHCIEGRVSLDLEKCTVELNSGQWVYLGGGEPYSVTGIENSSLLLTIIFEK